MMTNSKLNYWKKYCCEPLELVENYQQAKTDDFAGWCIHHRLEIQKDWTRVSRQELIDKNLYYGRPASELVFMRCGEHATLHSTGNKFFLGKHHSEYTRQKMSKTRKGKTLSEEHRQKIAESLKGKHKSEEHCRKNSLAHRGKHHSAETRRKLSEACIGKHLPAEIRQKIAESLKGKHHSAETRQKMSESAKGKHWWNDGVSCMLSRECPGEGWIRGRLWL